MSKCAELNYKVGDLFIFSSPQTRYAGMEGRIVGQLVLDDGTQCPGFSICPGEYPLNLPYSDCPSGLEKYFYYVDLSLVIKLDIKTKAELDVYCMLYPELAEDLLRLVRKLNHGR